MKNIVTRFAQFPLFNANLKRFCTQAKQPISNFDRIMENNKKWAADCIKQ